MPGGSLSYKFGELSLEKDKQVFRTAGFLPYLIPNREILSLSLSDIELYLDTGREWSRATGFSSAPLSCRKRIMISIISKKYVMLSPGPLKRWVGQLIL